MAVTTAIALMLQRPPEYLKKDGSYNIDLIIKEAYKTSEVLIEEKNQASITFVGLLISNLTGPPKPNKLQVLNMNEAEGVRHYYNSQLGQIHARVKAHTTPNLLNTNPTPHDLDPQPKFFFEGTTA